MVPERKNKQMEEYHDLKINKSTTTFCYFSTFLNGQMVAITILALFPAFVLLQYKATELQELLKFWNIFKLSGRRGSYDS